LTGEIEQVSGSQSDSEIQSIEMDKDGTRVALVRRGKEDQFDIEIWDVEERALVRKLTDCNNTWALAFSPIDRDVLLSAGTEVRLWNTSTGLSNLIVPLYARGKKIIITAEFSPTGKSFVIGGGAFNDAYDSFKAELWRVGSSTRVTGYEKITTKENYACKFTSGSGKIVFVDLVDDAIKLYDRATASIEASLQLGATRVFSIDIAEGHQCLVATSPSGAMTFVDLRTMEEIATFRVERPLRHVRFIDNEQRLVVSTMDGSILQWDF
jgi:WD40 repeat protein